MVREEIDVDDGIWNLFNARLDATIQEVLKGSVCFSWRRRRAERRLARGFRLISERRRAIRQMSIFILKLGR